MDVVDALGHLLGRGRIPFDPCTEPCNPTNAVSFCSPPHADGLKSEWMDGTYCNPPFGEKTESWIRKAVREADFGYRICLMLSVARTGSAYFQETILSTPKLTAVLFFKGRLAF